MHPFHPHRGIRQVVWVMVAAIDGMSQSPAILALQPALSTSSLGAIYDFVSLFTAQKAGDVLKVVVGCIHAVMLSTLSLIGGGQCYIVCVGIIYLSGEAPKAVHHTVEKVVDGGVGSGHRFDNFFGILLAALANHGVADLEIGDRRRISLLNFVELVMKLGWILIFTHLDGSWFGLGLEGGN